MQTPTLFQKDLHLFSKVLKTTWPQKQETFFFLLLLSGLLPSAGHIQSGYLVCCEISSMLAIDANGELPFIKSAKM